MRFELSYTQITVYALILTIFFDMFITKNSLLSTIRFWLSYAIIVPFQLEDLIFGFAMILAVMSMWEMLLKRTRS
jgi:hypothetical protein